MVNIIVYIQKIILVIENSLQLPIINSKEDFHWTTYWNKHSFDEYIVIPSVAL